MKYAKNHQSIPTYLSLITDDGIHITYYPVYGEHAYIIEINNPTDYEHSFIIAKQVIDALSFQSRDDQSRDVYSKPILLQDNSQNENQCFVSYKLEYKTWWE